MTAKNSESATISGPMDLLAKTWGVFRKNWPVFIIVNIFILLGSISQDRNYNMNKNENPFKDIGTITSGEVVAVLIISVFVLAIVATFYAMTVVLELRAAEGKTPTFSEVFSEAKGYIIPLALQAILSLIIIVIGLLLLIIPGLIAFGRLAVAPYLLVNKKLGAWEAIKQSNKLSANYDTAIWLAILAMLLVVIVTLPLGFIPVLGGLITGLVSIAFSAIFAVRYLEIKKHRKAISSE